MWTSDHGPTPDATLARERCDFCGHPHACYVGGSPMSGYLGDVASWGVHVCLGCLMRASVPGGFESCDGCALPVTGHLEGRSDA